MSPHARSYEGILIILCLEYSMNDVFLLVQFLNFSEIISPPCPMQKLFSLKSRRGTKQPPIQLLRIIEGRASIHFSFILHISWQPWRRHLPELSWWENKKTWQCWRKAKVKQAPSLDWMSRLFWLLGQQDHLNHFPWNRAGLKNQILEIEWMWGK